MKRRQELLVEGEKRRKVTVGIIFFSFIFTFTFSFLFFSFFISSESPRRVAQSRRTGSLGFFSGRSKPSHNILAYHLVLTPPVVPPYSLRSVP